MTAKENVERTIQALADHIEKKTDDANIVAAANAMARLYSSINCDMSEMMGTITRLLEEEKAKQAAPGLPITGYTIN